MKPRYPQFLNLVWDQYRGSGRWYVRSIWLPLWHSRVNSAEIIYLWETTIPQLAVPGCE